ncbi:MAG: hypothetical protein GXO37_03460 [Chloroflexi bacterium]|nr:hypothetical protein [Chloroflexota bacterium]
MWPFAWSPRWLMALAVGLLLFGTGVPFLTIIKVLPPSLGLLFLAFASIMLGPMIGFVAVSYWPTSDSDSDRGIYL